MRIILIAALSIGLWIGCLSARADNVQISDLKLYTSHRVGDHVEPYTPAIGEPYQITLDYNVTGTPTEAYLVRLEMANKHRNLKISHPTTGTHRVSAQFILPLDGSVKIVAQFMHNASAVDSDSKLDGGGSVESSDIDSNSFGQRVESTFTPRPPTKPIEYYNTKTVEGTQTAVVSFQPGGEIQRICLLAGDLTTESWQKVVQDECQVTYDGKQEQVSALPAENPTRYPVFFWERKHCPAREITLQHHFIAEVSSVRVDADQLRKTSWSDLQEAVRREKMGGYCMSTKIIEANDAAIASFVEAALGEGYQSKMNPYDAARRIFQAVLQHTTYYYSGDRPDTAVKVLQAGKGDCGGFSLLLCACWRHIGIPARTACGTWVGKDAGHCWSEMWVPPYGWVLSDGSAGNAQAEDGSYAYCFGNIPGLNARVAFMRGNFFNIGNIHTMWLQGPMFPALMGSARIAKFDSHTIIKDVSNLQSASNLPISEGIANPANETPEPNYRAPNTLELDVTPATR